MEIRQLQKTIYRVNKANGFNVEPLPEETHITLISSEIAEALEADRSGNYCSFVQWGMLDILGEHDFENVYSKRIKGTLDEELADVVIRILNVREVLKIASTTLPTVRCKSATLPEQLYGLNALLHHGGLRIEDKLNSALAYTLALCETLKIDIENQVKAKIRYNTTRPNKHNKAY